MKRLILLILSSIIVLLFTGCQNPVNKLLYKHTDSYIDEFKNSAEKLVDKSIEIPNDKVRVTFAKNEFIGVSYYEDSGFEKQIDEKDCFLNPGTTIYAKLKVNNTITKAYEFEGYLIYSYDNKGERELIGSLTMEDLVFKIPENYGGYDLSIQPIGKYVPIGINHQAYIIDENGTQRKANVDDCQWYIDGKKLTDDQTVSVSQYAISCEEINDNYYCVNSSPKFFSRNLSEKTVTFPSATPTEEPEDYIVYLREYICLNIDAESKADVSIKVKRENDDEYVDWTIEDNKAKKIIIGDKVIIEMKSEYELSSSLLSKYLSKPEEIENGEKKRYTFTVPEIDEIQICLLVRKSTDLIEFERIDLDNAVIEYQFKDADDLLVDGVKYDKNEKITYTIWPNQGFYVSGKGSSLQDGKFVFTDTVKLSSLNEKIKENLNNIKFKKLKTVVLDNSDEFGSIEYTVNGKTLSGKQLLREEDVIELNYTLPKDGKYIIDRDSSILNKVADLTKKYSETRKIEVSSLKDNTVSREDYIAIKGAHNNGRK